MMRYVVLAAALGFAGCAPTADSAAKKPSTVKIELQEVTYDGFDRAVASRKGEVIVIDVWATFCAPCMKKFPNLVALHEKYAEKGLVCMSVSTDAEEHHGKALDFLKEQKAHFPNYRFTESNEKISKELNEKYPTDRQPVMFVFDRAGNKVKQFEARDKPEVVEAFVAQLLEAK